MSKLARRSNGCAGGTVGVERSVREREVEREKNTGGSERKIREEREFGQASV